MNATIPPQMIASTGTNQHNRLEQSAQRLLSATGVLEALSQVGEVKIHGALQLRTMAWPEIDLYLGVAGIPTMANAAAVIMNLSNCIAIRDAHIINQVEFSPRFAYPETLLLDFTLGWERVEWKLDIALLPSKRLSEVSTYNSKLLTVMTDLQRRTIVEIKRQAIESPHYKRNNWVYVRDKNCFYSHDVYLAVINGHAKSYEEFRKVLKLTRNITL
ncbi:MAG: hypothetical protein AB4050_07385 [Synechococcus sp.]